VESGRHLLLAEPEDFADAVEQVLADPASADRLAAAGRDLVAAAFGWPALSDQLTHVVRTAAGLPAST
jgi:glycosyltransferase involved in cell wall biosynthesis